MYTEPTVEINKAIHSLRKKGEEFRVSGLINYAGKNYREVIIYKKGFSLVKKEAEAYIYLDEENSILKSQNVINELAKLAHFYEVFFSDEKGGGIVSALQNEGNVLREKSEFDEMINVLESLGSDGVREAFQLKNVMVKLIELRQQSNQIISDLADDLEVLKDKGAIFNEEILEQLYPKYEAAIKQNFEKVKLIASLRNNYDYIKDMADKKRKKLSNRFQRKITAPLLKLTYEIGYFKRVIRTYEKVLDMSSSQYSKFFNNVTKEKIEGRCHKARY
jgi:hypothetical protein